MFFISLLRNSFGGFIPVSKAFTLLSASIRASKFFIRWDATLAVIACIRDAESILIFGPGEAKGELKKRLQRNKLGGCIIAIETIDRMTDRQIAAKVRRYFQENRDKKGHL